MKQIPKQTRNDVIAITLLGAFVSIAGAVLRIDVGNGIVLTSRDAWDQGIAPTMVLFGVSLMLLGYYLFKGKTWCKWPIFLWLPSFFLVEIIVLWDLSPTSAQEFLYLGLPVLLVWTWGAYKVFSRKETIDYLSN